MTIEIFCDGSNHSKGSLPGGWAFVIVRDDVILAFKNGANPSTTNNVMELTAALEGIKWVIDNPQAILSNEKIELVSDSTYALNSAAGTYVAKANPELVAELRQAAMLAKISNYKWVAGHSGNTYNEMCDKLAKEAKMTLVPHKAKVRGQRKKEKRERKLKVKNGLLKFTGVLDK